MCFIMFMSITPNISAFLFYEELCQAGHSKLAVEKCNAMFDRYGLRNIMSRNT